MLAMGLRSMGKLNEAQEHFDYVEEIKEHLADANELAQRISSGKDSIDQRLDIANRFWKYGSEQEAMIWMRSAYQLDPLYLPTLEFMKRYYEAKIQDDPSLQEQLDRFTNEVAKAKARLAKEPSPTTPAENDTDNSSDPS